MKNMIFVVLLFAILSLWYSPPQKVKVREGKNFIVERYIYNEKHKLEWVDDNDVTPVVKKDKLPSTWGRIKVGR